MNVAPSWMVYVSEDLDLIYVPQDKNEKEKVLIKSVTKKNDDTLQVRFSEIKVIGDFVYYYLDGSIYRIKKDGTEKGLVKKIK